MTSTDQNIVNYCGNEAIDYAMNLNDRAFHIWEERSVWDCDTARTAESENEADAAGVWWTLLLYRDQTERISIRFHPNRHGDIDMKQKVELFIETGEPGEPATTKFSFLPKTDD